MFEAISFADRTITKFLYGILPHNHFFDTVFSFFSFNGASIIIWIIAAFLLILLEEKRDKKFFLYLIASLLVTFLLTNVLFKNIFQRHRPIQQPSYTISANCPRDFSFPSGHASVAFAGAIVLSVFDKKRRIVYYAAATLISYSRIYLGCHFFLDVFAGTLVGLLTGFIILRIPYKRFFP